MEGVLANPFNRISYRFQRHEPAWRIDRLVDDRGRTPRKRLNRQASAGPHRALSEVAGSRSTGVPHHRGASPFPRAFRPFYVNDVGSDSQRASDNRQSRSQAHGHRRELSSADRGIEGSAAAGRAAQQNGAGPRQRQPARPPPPARANRRPPPAPNEAPMQSKEFPPSPIRLISQGGDQ